MTVVVACLQWLLEDFSLLAFCLASPFSPQTPPFPGFPLICWNFHHVDQRHCGFFWHRFTLGLLHSNNYKKIHGRKDDMQKCWEEIPLGRFTFKENPFWCDFFSVVCCPWFIGCCLYSHWSLSYYFHTSIHFSLCSFWSDSLYRPCHLLYPDEWVPQTVDLDLAWFLPQDINDATTDI